MGMDVYFFRAKYNFHIDQNTMEIFEDIPEQMHCNLKKILLIEEF